MNRESPVPLWVVLTAGLILLGALYILAYRTSTRTQKSLVVPRQSVVSPTLGVSAPSDSITSKSSTSLPVTNLPAEGSSFGARSETPRSSLPPSTQAWNTYHNSAYGYAIKYPLGWVVTAPGQGAARRALPIDRNVTLAQDTGAPGISLEIDKLGSDEIGSYFQSAKTLDGFLSLLTSAGATSTMHFVRYETIDEHQAVRYTVCSDGTDAMTCLPRVYLQNEDMLYTIDDQNPDSVSEKLFDEVVGTMLFDDARS